MRQLHVQVRPDLADRVLEIANQHDAFSPTAVHARRADGEAWTMLFLNLPNAQVGPFVAAVEREADDAQIVIIPWGSLPIQTPISEVRERLRDVSPRSTLELVLSSLQSLGSWKGLLLYAFFSGVVAAYGLIVNASYLLVAAMLIAPMGAPGMVAVVGTGIGDWKMARRGALRFTAAILVLIATAAAMGYAYRLSVSTSMMEGVTSLSAFTVLLTLVAGAAGAQSQVQSERSSLVSGTATGFLIAAALSPTSAVLGLAIPLGRWDYVALMGWQVALQFFALLAAGWLTLLLFGVHPDTPSAGRGTARMRTLLVGGATAAVVALTAWQLTHTPRWVKADATRDATALVRTALTSVPGARLVEASSHFTRPELPGSGEAMLVNVTVEQRTPASADSLQSAVRTAVRHAIEQHLPGVRPFVDVTVLPGDS